MDSLLPTLCQRFPMSFGAIWLRMMALQVMEKYRHDTPWDNGSSQQGIADKANVFTDTNWHHAAAVFSATNSRTAAACSHH